MNNDKVLLHPAYIYQNKSIWQSSKQEHLPLHTTNTSWLNSLTECWQKEMQCRKMQFDKFSQLSWMLTICGIYSCFEALQFIVLSLSYKCKGHLLLDLLARLVYNGNFFPLVKKTVEKNKYDHWPFLPFLSICEHVQIKYDIVRTSKLNELFLHVCKFDNKIFCFSIVDFYQDISRSPDVFFRVRR